MMMCVKLLLYLMFVGGSWRHVRSTCVLESEFGFKLNCAFKKSGLFRVRNLGGIKAHVGLGFTVGDELGFSESLSNLEANRRRSTQTNGFQNAVLAANAQKNSNNRLTVRQPQYPVANAAKAPTQNVRTKTDKLAATIPPFKPIPPAPERPITPTDRILAMAIMNKTKPVRPETMPSPALVGVAVPAFQAMPASISRISSAQTVPVNKPVKTPMMALVMNPSLTTDKSDYSNKLSSSNLALRTLPNQTAGLPAPLPQTSSNSVQALASVSNITMEAIEAAILLRQQQLMKQQQFTTTFPTTTTTTPRPTTSAPKRQLATASKVMNAPKEYYPVGYDKNFDDNFASRVELPDTSFYCGDQKHFPGLYADEDLGCMVFHVCALTDDGLIMKSFLCPESTLFDQTILKCNWWFYVDCKNSKKLYDSNIPISKSYQLMKALTFFSSYKSSSNGASSSGTGNGNVTTHTPVPASSSSSSSSAKQ